MRKRERGKTGGNPGLAQELSSRWRFAAHKFIPCLICGLPYTIDMLDLTLGSDRAGER
jgi:hypothetical protein